jgi:uncharacterized SAM-binding protein YcdF (DUF218 family)
MAIPRRIVARAPAGPDPAGRGTGGHGDRAGAGRCGARAGGRAAYDAVIVLGSGIRRDGRGYRPVTYENHDKFGMVAGEIRVVAAALLYEHDLAGTFVFSTGMSEQTRAALGPDVPAEAVVYSQDFLRRTRSAGRPDPVVILEDRSVNTYSNLVECIAIIREHDWEQVAIVTARYHVPRVRGLWEVAKGNHPVATGMTFLAAEDIVIRYLPGIYDEIIDAAYDSRQGLKRLRNEAKGLQDLNDGRYVLTEFQPPGELDPVPLAGSLHRRATATWPGGRDAGLVGDHDELDPVTRVQLAQ